MSDGAVIVAIGASAGGVEALRDLVRRLPNDFPAAILIVLHLPPAAKSQLAEILDRAGALPAVAAVDREPVVPGTIVVAPSDHHLRVRGTMIALDPGPKISGHRPAIDPLFESVAAAYGSTSIGVLLSGMLHDGALGLLCMKQAGALTVAQDPAEALFPDLPAAAIALDAATEILPVEKIAEILIERAFQSDATPVMHDALVTQEGQSITEPGEHAS